MKIRFLLLGTSLSLIPQTINAQCVATQDCATLGYTETSCSGGTGVKCPFGNKWACFKSESEINQLCTELGFTLSCTGSNQTGVGKACNGKYTECTCAEGYVLKDGNCLPNGAHGDLYYCNGTVVGVKASGMNFYIAMKDVGTMNRSDAFDSCYNYVFCSNLKGYLPDKDQLLTIYNNKSTINSLLLTNGGTNLSSYYWSSSSDHSYGIGSSVYYRYYYVDMSYGYVDSDTYGKTKVPVRPVMSF